MASNNISIITAFIWPIALICLISAMVVLAAAIFITKTVQNSSQQDRRWFTQDDPLPARIMNQLNPAGGKEWQ